MSEDLEDRAQSIKLELAEKLMKTIPALPDDIDDKSPEEIEKLFEVIDSRAERILSLIGGTRGRGPGRRPRATNTRQSERFNTPELDREPRRRRKSRSEDDEE